MRRDEGKILGIIGGMGPLATQEFYKMVIERTDAERDQDHINTIILSHATLPDRTKAVKEGRVEEFAKFLEEDIKLLEEMGACAAAIPCNTSHIVVPGLQKKTGLHIINMIEETASRINELGKHKKVGILATDGTIKTKLYQKALEKYGIEAYQPCKNSQAVLMSIIYDGIKAGGNIDIDQFKHVEDEIKECGCTAAILACTELSCFRIMYKLPEFYIDAMEILAEEAVMRCGGKLKKLKK